MFKKYFIKKYRKEIVVKMNKAYTEILTVNLKETLNKKHDHQYIKGFNDCISIIKKSVKDLENKTK